MKYSEEILVLRAKVVNKKFCSSDCPFFTEVANTSGHVYKCNLFGALEIEGPGNEFLYTDGLCKDVNPPSYSSVVKPR